MFVAPTSFGLLRRFSPEKTEGPEKWLGKKHRLARTSEELSWASHPSCLVATGVRAEIPLFQYQEEGDRDKLPALRRRHKRGAGDSCHPYRASDRVRQPGFSVSLGLEACQDRHSRSRDLFAVESRAAVPSSSEEGEERMLR
eukprot:TRINITY_DN17436_c0_g2_i1.p1 TRINITY_DN17436_c0_g2~~TRINITY_DN17436_c0_g2_i1.p1  ORF type:complete len:142 (+),score=17.96 TRINITY_DN17436_c0_g2_i1:1328-1753(+)